jgi:hypothetical protein
MTIDLSKLLLGPDHLVRFDLRAQFAMNRIMREIGQMASREMRKLGDPTIAPYLFTRRTRSFQSFAADQTSLSDLSDQAQEERLRGVRRLLADVDRSKWVEYLTVVDAHDEADSDLGMADWRDKHGRLSYLTWLDRYFRYRAPRDSLLNGVLWDYLCKTNQGPALAALLVQFDAENHRDVNGTSHHEGYTLHFGADRLSRLTDPLAQKRSSSRGDLWVHEKLVEIFAFGGGRSPTMFNHVLLIPVYDYYIAGEPWGGIAATLQIPITVDVATWGDEELVVNLARRLQSSIEVVSLDLAAAGMQRIASDPIGFPLSLVHEWMRGLQYLQDWDKIRIERHGRAPLVWVRGPCDHRGKPDSYGMYSALLPSPTHASHESQSESCPVIEFLAASSGASDEVSSPSATVDLLGAIRFDDRTERGRSVNLPGVGRITFVFPGHFRLPRAVSADPQVMLSVLCDVLVRQQKELLHSLVPKVAARRAAVRTAVSAIMGRNLSHNIGSHVLARYGSEIRLHDYPADDNAIDPRTEFLSYLQRRMDFLAEVATADHAFWARSVSLKEAVERLDILQETDLYRVSPGDTAGADGPARRPILLSYITGKELPATVRWGPPGEDPPRDHSFACPSGEVGLHALYVILENIIRNSARHAPTRAQDEHRQPVVVHVVVPLKMTDDATGNGRSKADLFEVQFVDPRSEWGASIEGEAPAYLATINRVLRASDDNSDLVDTDAQLLDAQGEVNPKNWGVREMQICAQFLRGLPLSELEGERADPPVLKAITYDLGGGRRCLAYQLWLQRPRDVALVCSDSIDIGCADDAAARGVRKFAVNASTGAPIDWAKIVDGASKYGVAAVAEELVDDLEQWVQAKTTELHPAEANRWALSRKHLMPMRWAAADHELISGLAGSSRDQRCDALERLHLAVARKYLRNGVDKRQWWVEKPIGVLYGVGGPDAESTAVDVDTGANGDQQLHLATVGINNLHDLIKNNTGAALPWMAKPLIWDDQPEMVQRIGVAFLDHGSDEFLKLTTGAQFKYAGVPQPGTTRRSIWLSVESTRSASAHRAVLEHVRRAKAIGSVLRSDLAELAAAAAARVVVLDERIQKCRNDRVASVSLHRAWVNSGIWSPRKPEDFLSTSPGDLTADSAVHAPVLACDLNAPSFERLRAFLKEPTLLSWQCPADVLVIHLTILERIAHERRSHEGDVLRELVRGTSCDAAQIVVVTGRGVPAAAWKRAGGIDARYLPISAIQEYLVSRPSKLGFMRVLWAARAPR